MILADTLSAVIAKGIARGDPMPAEQLAEFDEIPKFVFETATAKLAAEAIVAPDKVASQIPLPAAMTWLEFHLPGGRIGFCLHEKSPGAGDKFNVLFVSHPHGEPLPTADGDHFDRDAGGLQRYPHYNPLLLGALALLGVPALIERRKIDQSRLNRARAKRGKPLLHNHVELRLHDLDLARPQPTSAELRAAGERTGRRRHRREHFCRAHLRFRAGKMELVRPHWRGDATLGRVVPAYRVRA
jgi:hypothetical protein